MPSYPYRGDRPRSSRSTAMRFRCDKATDIASPSLSLRAATCVCAISRPGSVALLPLYRDGTSSGYSISTAMRSPPYGEHSIPPARSGTADLIDVQQRRDQSAILARQ